MYRRGVAYEYRVKKKLEAEGWTVLRMAGSHGFVDLVAIKLAMDTYPLAVVEDSKIAGTLKLNLPPTALSQIRLIQCKSGKSKLRMVKDVLKSDIKRFEGLYSVTVEFV